MVTSLDVEKEQNGSPLEDVGGDERTDRGDIGRQEAGPAPGAKPKRKRPAARGRLRSVADYDKEIERNRRLRSRSLARERRKEKEQRAAEKRVRDRRLVILGASLLAAGNRGDEEARRLVALTLEHLRPGDSKSFDGWKPDWEADDGK